MSSYTSYVPQSPSPATGYFWQFNGPAPATISTNDANGVTGIQTAIPSFPNQRFQLSEDTGNYYGVFQLIDNLGGTYTVGTATIGLTPFGVLIWVDATNNQSIGFSVDGTWANSIVTIVGTAISEIRHNGNRVEISVADLTTGDSVQQNKSASGDNLTIEVAGVDVFKRLYGATGVMYEDGAGAVLFQVEIDGKIRTNQTAPPGLHAALVAEMPIYDVGGALVGYIPIMN